MLLYKMNTLLKFVSINFTTLMICDSRFCSWKGSLDNPQVVLVDKKGKQM